MVKRFWLNSDMMSLTFMIWLCALPLVAIFVVPFFGLAVGGGVALALLLALALVCLSICGWRMDKQKRKLSLLAQRQRRRSVRPFGV
jgi:predicted ABC-type exoprotein transport system permease subunit